MPQVQQLLLANGFPFPAVSMLRLQLAMRQHKPVTNQRFYCVCDKNEISHCWSVAGFGSFQKASNLPPHETNPRNTTGSVQALSPHKHVQKFWSSTTDNRVVHPTQHSYRIVERVLLHHTHSSPPNVEEAKAIAPFKLHSHPVWYGQKFSRLLTNRPVRHHQKGGSGTQRRLGVASGQHLNKRLW